MSENLASDPASGLPMGKAGMVTIKLESELPRFKENLNLVSSVSLLMTSSTALTNEGLFELSALR